MLVKERKMLTGRRAGAPRRFTTWDGCQPQTVSACGVLPMLANMQLEKARRDLFSPMCRFAAQNGAFHRVKRRVSQAKTTRFASRNGSFYNVLAVRWLAGAAHTVAFNIKKLTAMMLCRDALSGTMAFSRPSSRGSGGHLLPAVLPISAVSMLSSFSAERRS